MKKIVILLAALSLLAISCNKDSKWTVITTGSEPAVSSVTLSGKIDGALKSEDVTEVGFLVCREADMTGPVEEFSTSLNGDKTFSRKVTLAEFEGSRGRTYYYCAYAESSDGRHTGKVQSFSIKEVPAGAVDLGLDVFWAECNLSDNGFVSSPEQYGDYYAWGETKSKSNYSTSNYFYKDTPETLPLSADAAHAILGGDWRMPTKEELQTLLDNCTSVWTTQNGVNGRLFKSKINGKSIFFPAAGYRCDASLDFAGSEGYYWSSSLTATGGAWSMDFYSGDVIWFDSNPFCGLSVRPVSE